MKKTEEWSCPDKFESEADYSINFTGNTRSPRFFNHIIYYQFEDEVLDNQQLSLKEDYLRNNIHDFSNQNVEYFSESDDHEQPLAGTRKWVRQVVQETGGHGERLLLWKRLSESDLENRISMPVIYLLDESDEFLKEEDINALLRWKHHHDDLKGFQDVDVTFFEPYVFEQVHSAYQKVLLWHKL
ncbi:hypothetical protein L484_027935 [Morus notabilis]|uniref:Uncharacterized protein n=1 Tax=Morus notabilis TaxID=981085 RepID=W9S7H5_9ROSA|nr:hypothetical protein L484_027935 [Morus notabilis]